MTDRQATRPTDTIESAYRSRTAIAMFASVFVLLLAADLGLKWWAFDHVAEQPVDLKAVSDAVEARELPPIPPHDHITLVPHVLALKLVANPGAVFGMMAGARWLFVAFTAVAIAFVGYVFCTSASNHRLVHVCLGMILAGAVGNLYDRIVYGFVRDMLYLFPEVKLPFGWHWGNGSDEVYPWIFNLADSYLLIGITAILIWSLFFDTTHAADAPTASDSGAATPGD